MAEVSDRLRRGPSVRVSLGVGIVGTVIIVLVGIAGPYLRQATAPHPPAAPRFVAVHSNPVSAAPAVAASASRPAMSLPAMSPPATDDRGFLNSFARCDVSQTLVVLGRTDDSAVAICAGADGQYVYRGVRSSRGTTLNLGGVTVTPDGFVARNAGVVYTVTAHELVITSGDGVLSREPMVDYRTR